MVKIKNVKIAQKIEIFFWKMINQNPLVQNYFTNDSG